MSVRTLARVWADSRQSGPQLLMLLAIADFADDDGNAYPSVQTLAEKCRMKARNAQVVLSALRLSGELEVRPNEGPHGTNRYRILPLAGVQSLAGGGGAKPCGVQDLAGVQKKVGGGARSCAKPLQELAWDPSLNRHEPSVVHARAARTPTADRGTRLPSDWVLTEDLAAWAREKRPELDVEAVAEGFRDYWIAQPGQKGLRSDWKAVWRTWVRNQRQQHGPAARAAPQSQRPLLGDDDHVFTGEGLRHGRA